MINRFQKGLWIFSSGSPIFIAFSITWYISGKSYLPSLISMIVGLLLILYAFSLLEIMAKKLTYIEISAKKVVQNDKIIIGYFISYILPFGSISFDKYNPLIFYCAALMLYCILIILNTPTANPLLIMSGYHFYDIEGENGIGNYLLISKKSIRNKNEINLVQRVTEYLLLDIGGKENV